MKTKCFCGIQDIQTTMIIHGSEILQGPLAARVGVTDGTTVDLAKMIYDVGTDNVAGSVFAGGGVVNAVLNNVLTQLTDTVLKSQDSDMIYIEDEPTEVEIDVPFVVTKYMDEPIAKCCIPDRLHEFSTVTFNTKSKTFSCIIHDSRDSQKEAFKQIALRFINQVNTSPNCNVWFRHGASIANTMQKLHRLKPDNYTSLDLAHDDQLPAHMVRDSGMLGDNLQNKPVVMVDLFKENKCSAMPIDFNRKPAGVFVGGRLVSVIEGRVLFMEPFNRTSGFAAVKNMVRKRGDGSLNKYTGTWAKLFKKAGVYKPSRNVVPGSLIIRLVDLIGIIVAMAGTTSVLNGLNINNLSDLQIVSMLNDCITCMPCTCYCRFQRVPISNGYVRIKRIADMKCVLT